MEKIQIRKRKDATGDMVNIRNYDVIIDGEKQKLPRVKGIDIKLDAGEKPVVTITANPKYLELDIDGEVETIEDVYKSDD